MQNAPIYTYVAIVENNNKLFCILDASTNTWSFPSITKESFNSLDNIISAYSGLFGVPVELGGHIYVPKEGLYVQAILIDDPKVEGKNTDWLDIESIFLKEWNENQQPILNELCPLFKVDSFTMTLNDNPGPEKIVWKKKCTHFEMRNKFYSEIYRQGKSLHANTSYKWRQIRVYDSQGNIICQES